MQPSTQDQPSLRPAVPDDTDFLLRLYRSTREPELAALPWTEAQKAAFCTMQFAAQVAGYGHSFPQAEQAIVVAPGGEPAGRLISARQDDALLLVDISLLPAYRGRGWGTLLIRALQDEAAALGLAVRLSVERHNPALNLYQRLGFAIIGVDTIRLRMSWSRH